MKALLFLFLLPPLLYADPPEAFGPLGTQLASELEALKGLEALEPFEGVLVEAYADEMQRCFETGYALDTAVAEDDPTGQALRSDYLTCLRALQGESVRWQHRYALSLDAAIDAQEPDRFELLVSNPLEPLQRPSLKRKAMAYYESLRETRTITVMEAIRDDMRIEERSPAFLSTEKNAFKKDQSVLDTQEAEASDRPVLVSTKREGNRFSFYAQNKNIYPVTLTIDFSKLENFRASKPLPLLVELSPYATQQVLDVDVVDRGQGASYASSYGWVMGRYSARHSDPEYRLPFAVGSKAVVSQGFAGGITHKGLTQYAVDFQCPVGTKVYAARGGKVVAAESGHNKGGFDKRFGDQANYIIIEHDDHTLGKYYHLKQHGVMVRVGESVRRGEMIGYSGNTGYSSGPHLHFSVSSVDPQTKKLPVTLPFRFQTAEGVIDAPRSGDVFRVVKVR